MKRTIRLILILAMLAAAGGGAYWYFERDADETTAFQGYMEGNLVYMAPEEGGRIERLAVEVGDSIAEGQTVCSLLKRRWLVPRYAANEGCTG
jgi:HlyD family secretion protein